jgi:hypothetical protein
MPNPPPLAVTLGDAFAAELRQWLNDAEWLIMRQRNAVHGASSMICASHDFCDANMAMDAAFASVTGREFSPNCEGAAQADVDLWNHAWRYAKAKHLGAGQ